jgi:hypothetical protein
MGNEDNKYRIKDKEVQEMRLKSSMRLTGLFEARSYAYKIRKELLVLS